MLSSSFPSPTCPRASLHLGLVVLKARLFYDSERESGPGAHRLGEVQERSPTLAGLGLGLGRDSEPSCLPGASPLLLSASSQSPTLGSPPVLASFILKSKLFVSLSKDFFCLIPLCGWLPVQKALKHLKLSLGKNSEVATSWL